MYRTTARVLIAALAIIPIEATLVFAADPPAQVFVGYLFGPPRDVDYRLYTHLCHAFLTADADGSIHPPRGVSGRELTEKAHAANVAVLLSLGGWGWDEQFARIAADPRVEARYVTGVMDLVD